MESKSKYQLLDSPKKEWAFSAMSMILMFFSLTVLAVFCYNPIASSLGFAFGIAIWLSGVVVIDAISKLEIRDVHLPHPVLCVLLWTGFQVNACIGYHYNPMNHGAISTLLSLSFLPAVIFGKTPKWKFIPASIALIGYAATIYRSVHVWLHLSVLYSSISFICLSVLLGLPRSKTTVRTFLWVALGNLFLNVAIVAFLMSLKVYPLEDEKVLLIYTSGAGIVFGAAVFIAILYGTYKISVIAYSLIGMAQVFIEALVFWMTLFGQLFIVVLPVFVGVQGSLIISLWEKPNKQERPAKEL